VESLIASRFNDTNPEISPDGRWLAYTSNELGHDEVYVQAFPGLGDKVRISTAGGSNPAWSRDHRKLFFLSQLDAKQGSKWQLMEVDVTLGATFTKSLPRRLFDSPVPADVRRGYDPAPDGRRFVFLRETHPPSTSAPREMHVIQNWTEELKRLAPRSP
jgi:hypothetical protein